MPLRVMLTGTPHTPSIDAVLELIGRDEVLRRMDSEAGALPRIAGFPILYRGKPGPYNAPLSWGYSSAGRALAWHARGQRFDPAYLHHEDTQFCLKSPSSRGLGHRPFTAVTGVRIPVGTPKQNRHPCGGVFVSAFPRVLFEPLGSTSRMSGEHLVGRRAALWHGGPSRNLRCLRRIRRSQRQCERRTIPVG